MLFKKFVKRNWKEITIIVLLLAVIGKLRYDYKQLENTYEASQQSLQNQIDGLQEIHAEELQKKETALQTYRDALELLEREYEQDRNKIEVVVEERIVEIETTIDNRKQFGHEAKKCVNVPNSSQKTEKNSQNK